MNDVKFVDDKSICDILPGSIVHWYTSDHKHYWYIVSHIPSNDSEEKYALVCLSTGLWWTAVPRTMEELQRNIVHNGMEVFPERMITISPKVPK